MTQPNQTFPISGMYIKLTGKKEAIDEEQDEGHKGKSFCKSTLL